MPEITLWQASKGTPVNYGNLPSRQAEAIVELVLADQTFDWLVAWATPDIADSIPDTRRTSWFQRKESGSEQ